MCSVFYPVESFHLFVLAFRVVTTIFKKKKHSNPQIQNWPISNRPNLSPLGFEPLSPRGSHATIKPRTRDLYQNLVGLDSYISKILPIIAFIQFCLSWTFLKFFIFFPTYIGTGKKINQSPPLGLG